MTVDGMKDVPPRKKRRLARPKLRLRFNLRKAMFVLPNLFTVSSIFCGFYAIVLSSGTPTPVDFYRATLAVFFGIFFDMADGRVARLTKTQSDFGVQLDSLADVCTFGVAPAVIVYHWALAELGLVGAIASFTYMACGALRLARFNVLAARGLGSKKFFIGLPIPLAAGVVMSLVMFHQLTFQTHVVRPWNIFVLVLVIAYLMVSNVRYRAFKDVKPSKKAFAIAFALLGLFAFLALRVQPAFALVSFFGAYVLYGLLEEVVFFGRRRREQKAQPTGVDSEKHESPDAHHEVHR